MENYMEVVSKNNMVTITTDTCSLSVPEATINKITELTNDREDTCQLLAFLRNMVNDYNNYAQMQNEQSNRLDFYWFKFSPAFMEVLCTMLLSTGFCTDQIISALTELSDYELFGGSVEDEKEDPIDRVVRITGLVKEVIMQNDLSEYFTNDDDPEPPKIKGLSRWN